MKVNPFVPLAAPLVLASTSPRRAALLDEAGIPFSVAAPRVGEDVDPAWGPSEHAVALALRKARDVASRVSRGIVLGADTVVIAEGGILGKPASGHEARAMLGRLAGRMHEVVTGLAAVARPADVTITGSARTLVWMRSMSAAEIDHYVATGEPMDKAGAYGIQGAIAAAVERIDGCYFNVVGLPLSLAGDMIARLIRDPRVRLEAP